MIYLYYYLLIVGIVGDEIIDCFDSFRFCANINRQHKSNNIFWIADLAKKIVYQKCHDEDCANFVSTPIPIPDEVRFQMDDEFDDLILNMPNPEADQSENQSR